MNRKYSSQINRATLLTTLLGAIAIFTVVGCGETGAKRTMQVGEQAVILPVEPGKVVESGDSFARKHQNTLLSFELNGNPLKYEEISEVQIFKAQNDKEPVYLFSVDELKDMSVATGCNVNLKSFVEAENEVKTLFCDQSFHTSKANLYVLKMKDKTERKATYSMLVSDDRDADVLMLKVLFY